MSQLYTEIKMERCRITVNGIVQGVGFRPFVYNLAESLSLTGFVTNTSKGVELEIQGDPATIETFLNKLKQEKPPLADILNVTENAIPPVKNEMGFSILQSEQAQEMQTLISPDICICDQCLQELFDPENRRFRYPFINCTNCGPRYTIIKSIPYDRPATTMHKFTMCSDCLEEYNNPSNRRFHAQPNACAKCGPKIWMESVPDKKVLAEENDTIDHVVEALLDGKIAGIKGLGGFHLAVNATDQKAVNRLRKRKNREEKPLAIMVPDLELARQIVHCNPVEICLLESSQRPIVLLRKKEQIPVVESIAPGNRRLGILLPYTPLHHLLMKRLHQHTEHPILVMTSANLSEEPIVMHNEEARRRLNQIADVLLLHNRDILVRADDSVVSVIAEKTTFIRRSRGYVPRPVQLASTGIETIAVGGHLKNTICILKKDQAFLSQHIGDLENLEAYKFFEESIIHFAQINNASPEVLVHDLHPGYFSTQWAQDQDRRERYFAQHHHAHLASCMAEWRLKRPVIGIILDGTGYGYDKTIWGGEILIGEFTRFRRFAHLENVPVPGAQNAILEPWRVAVGYLYKSYGEHIPELPGLQEYPVEPVKEMVIKKINSPLTSSCGRLFDAVAALCGGRTEIRYEAQAAIELMQISGEPDGTIYPFDFAGDSIILTEMIKKIVEDVKEKTAIQDISSRFHATLLHLFTEAADKARKESGINDVVLSGGVFQNEIILSGLVSKLAESGFNVYYQKQVPANDGGLSLGQAIIGRSLHQAGMEEVMYENN